MIDFKALQHSGSTDDALRELFQAQPVGDEDRKNLSEEEVEAKEALHENRIKAQDLIESRISEAVAFSLRNHHYYSAVDLAWDGMPINKRLIPLIQYAQGRVDVTSCARELATLDCADQYVKKNDKGEVIDLDMPKFFEVNVNLIRSILSRRVAAQSNKYSNLWPFFKFESRSTQDVNRLKADLTSQRIDIMADQYGFRSACKQNILDMFLYSHSITFPRAPWERDVQWRAEEGMDGNPVMKASVVREGVSFVTPHPSRVFWDLSYPVKSLNSDTGCEFAGYWDIQRWRDVKHNPDFFNRNEVGFGQTTLNKLSNHSTYFNQYYSQITPPRMPEDDITEGNDRKNIVGYYSTQDDDTSVITTEFFWKIIPKDWGVGDYPFPVWTHIKVAGDNTVVWAKFLPSNPCAVYSFNESDHRVLNNSVAHDLMPYQDQLSNLFSELLETIKADLFSVAVINTDVFPDTKDGKAVLAEFRDIMEGGKYSTGTHVLEASFGKLEELGIKTDPSNVFKVVRSSPNNQIGDIFRAITTLISTAERMMALSPQELGQPAPRETSATEVQIIANTTESVYSYISDSIDEGRAAMKRICYESMISLGKSEVTLPVKNRYPDAILEQAGITEITRNGTGGFDALIDKSFLIHDYAFNSRDGAERTSNVQAANTLVQLMGTLQLPQIAQRLGEDKLFSIINAIFRLSGAGVDLNLEASTDSPIDPSQQALPQVVAELSQVIEELAADVDALKGGGQPQSQVPVAQ